MDDRQTFRTEAEAMATARDVVGWPDPHPVEITTDDGTAWTVAVDPDDGPRQPRYLRLDGYIR